MSKKLPIDLGELTLALDNTSWEINYYLDLETGDIALVTDETRRELEELYAEIGEAETDLAELLQERDLPDWRKQALLEADLVETGYGNRFIAIPQADSHQGYHDMEDFILTVPDQRLQDRLWQAIRGRGAFRYFKDVLAGQPEERERWFAFQGERLEQRAMDWLASQGIEPALVRVQGRD